MAKFKQIKLPSGTMVKAILVCDSRPFVKWFTYLEVYVIKTHKMYYIPPTKIGLDTFAYDPDDLKDKDIKQKIEECLTDEYSEISRNK